MKIIKGIGYYKVNDKHIVIVSDDYHGSPIIMWEYDIILCNKRLLSRYRSNLVAKHLTDNGWKPVVKYIQ